MKTMYISARFENNICATIHLQALKKLIQKDELFIVDLFPEHEYYEDKNIIRFGSFGWIEWKLRAFEKNTWYLSNIRIKKICKIIKDNDIKTVFIDESIFGKLVVQIKKKIKNIKVIAFYHDIAADIYPKWLKDKGESFRYECNFGLSGEYLTQKWADINLVLNNRDAILFERYYGHKIDGLLPMAVADPVLNDFNFKELHLKKNESDKFLLFVSAFYSPNLEGLKWYAEKVMTQLPDKYKLIVVGRGMEKVRDEYSHYKNIIIIGGVESLAAAYNCADIVIAPLFSGGGMKQKTAEAFAYGKPFIGTTESLQGYEEVIGLKSGEKTLVYCCDEPKQQIESLKMIEKEGAYGYFKELNSVYKNEFSVDAMIKRMRAIVL